MTKLKLVMNMMLPLIPSDYKTEISEDISLAEHGVMEMGVSLGKEFSIVDVDGEPITTMNADGRLDDDYYITPMLGLRETYLASHYAYRTYLMNLKDSFNRDAINFKTLTFEIKSLEKRPEAIGESLALLNRHLEDIVSDIKGSRSVVGKASKFGGGSNE